jgi:isochorismate pyruvate lyase
MRAREPLVERGPMSKPESGLSPQDEMADVRKEIDALDDKIVALFAQRQRQIERAAHVKPSLGMPALVQERVDEVLARVLGASRREGMSAQLAHHIWTAVIDWSIQYEERLMGDNAPKGDDGKGDGG